MASIAHLFLDETGDFSPNGDDMRMVGGLLVVTQASVEKDLEQIHASVTNALRGPFGSTHASSSSRAASCGGTLWEARRSGLFSTPRRWSLSTLRSPPFHKRRRTSGGLFGSQYRACRRRARIEPCSCRSVRSSCGARRHFCEPRFSNGAVDRSRPSSSLAMLTSAFRAEPKRMTLGSIRLYVSRYVLQRKAGASGIDVEIAEPGVQTVSEIERRALRANGIARVAIVKYDVGTYGLWLADSLLAWTRPPPRAVAVSALLIDDIALRPLEQILEKAFG